MTQLLSFIAGGTIFRSSFNFFGGLLSESTFPASAPGRLDLESTVPVVAGTRYFHVTAIAMNARAFKRYFQRNVQEWTLFSYSPWDWSHCPASSRCRAARISLSPEAAPPPLIIIIIIIVKPKSSPKSRSQIPNPKSKVQRKRNGTGADNIILQAWNPYLKCKSSNLKRPSMTFLDLPWPSLTFLDLP